MDFIDRAIVKAMQREGYDNVAELVFGKVDEEGKIKIVPRCWIVSVKDKEYLEGVMAKAIRDKGAE